MTKSTEQLINNIIGQLEGLKKMMTEGRDCEKIIVQMKAAKSAFTSLMVKFIDESSDTCFSGKKVDEEKLKKLMKEAIRN